ncbi:MAG: hypothetical protein HWD84_11165 [Flavobacteriaceae bacterium]|nr:hypothetical protein [Flavobacteriaceae bacterium]
MGVEVDVRASIDGGTTPLSVSGSDVVRRRAEGLSGFSLFSLGFCPPHDQQPLRHFSGGIRMHHTETRRPMKLLIRDVLRARHGRRNFLEHPSVAEIHARLPEDLLEWFEKVVIIEEDPLTIHCSPIDKSDVGYFRIWRYMRDQDHPDCDPEDGICSRTDDFTGQRNTF